MSSIRSLLHHLCRVLSCKNFILTCLSTSIFTLSFRSVIWSHFNFEIISNKPPSWTGNRSDNVRWTRVSPRFHDSLMSLGISFRVFKKVLPNVVARPLKSDVVELRHCNLEEIDYRNFSFWAHYVLSDARPNFEMKIKKKFDDVEGMRVSDWHQFMEPELTLGLLEMYATQNGFCDFSKYPLEIPIDLSNQTEKLKSVPSSDRLPRLVMVIIAFQDAKHLERLVRAVYLPHHVIIIHLDRVTPLKFERQVNKIATRYSNVVVVKFGMVIYRTDSVSMINYKIMNWLVNVVQLKYDYHLTLDGASFPLYKAITLALYIKNHHRHVWLGQLLHQGKVLAAKNSRQWAYLTRKRIIFTAGKKSYQQRTKKIERHGFISSISETIRTNMTKKTNSGNQGIFSYDVVKKLTMSAEVKEMFAQAKYGCCCCIEERTWFAATRIIGYKDHALEKASTFQVWGGNITCAPSMNNAILRMNSSICYKSEDASSGSLALQSSENQQIDIYIRGDEILHQIKVAKRRGFLFARKFSSEDKGSMQLLNYIQQEVL